MEYITGRVFRLSESAEEFARPCRYNLWRAKLWPYEELVAGDVLYWYESRTGCIVWKSKVTQVERFRYRSKEEVRARLEEVFGETFDADEAYYVKAPDHGYCLAYRVAPLERLRVPKPSNTRFPRQGWLRVEEAVTRGWELPSGLSDNAVLDDTPTAGSLAERLQQLNALMRGVRPERVERLMSQTVRRDTAIVQALKEACGFQCQFPGCNVRIPKKGGGFYIEVAHIKPVRAGGQSVLGNLLVLCPNHHKEFDVGDLRITAQTVWRVRGTLNGVRFEVTLPLQQQRSA